MRFALVQPGVNDGLFLSAYQTCAVPKQFSVDAPLQKHEREGVIAICAALP
jgi:hypothetical protein